MQPLALTTSNFNSGYYNNNLKINHLKCDSPDNIRSTSNSPKSNSLAKDRSESPCENQITSQIKNSLIYLQSKHLVSNSLSGNKMSKGSSILQTCSTNNENNINKHNINNNLNHNLTDNGQIDKQVFLTPLVRFRRLLSSIHQHANNVSSETGDQVHSVIIGLVSATYTIDEFQIKIQELVSYPLRSHIINFMRNFLPGFQAEINQLAHLSKQSIVQFVKQNETIFLETNQSSSMQTPVDLDELLLTTSAAANQQQLKRRFSPDYILDSENFGAQSSKRFHSSLNTASPPIKLQNGSIVSNSSKTLPNSSLVNNLTINSSKLNNNVSSAMNSNSNASILHNHLTQARTAMLEELMSNRYYQTPIQQQFNLINQHLNQQIAHGNVQQKKPQSNLVNLNNVKSNSLNSNQLTNQYNNHLQSNLLMNNNQMNLNKQKLALLDRYEKEIASQSKQFNSNNLRSNLNLDSNLHLRANMNLNNLTQQQLVNNLNLNSSIPTNGVQSNVVHQSLRTTNEQINNEEEWKTIDTMLNCIVGMVEKTRRALSILQQRNQENLVQSNESISPTDWQRTNATKMPLKTIPINKNLNNINSNQINMPIKSATPPIDSEYLDLRKSKDPLFSSLNFTASSPKVSLNRVNAQTDLMSIEKNKMEQIFQNLRRQAAQDAIVSIQEEGLENYCWNCNRQAQKVCTGCNQAKYCSTFCHKKDWETHQLICAKNQIVLNGSVQMIEQSNDIIETPVNKNLKLKTDLAESPNSPANLTPTDQPDLELDKKVEVNEQENDEKDKEEEIKVDEAPINIEQNSDNMTSSSIKQLNKETAD